MIDGGNPSPAFSLSRSVYEGYIRGEWLMHCASDEQVNQFLSGDEMRSENGTKLLIKDLIVALELKNAFIEKRLSEIKSNAWGALCDFAHVGGRLVSQWNSNEGIEVNFSAEDINSVLILTGIFAALGAVGLCELQVPPDDSFAEQILEQVREFNWKD